MFNTKIVAQPLKNHENEIRDADDQSCLGTRSKANYTAIWLPGRLGRLL